MTPKFPPAPHASPLYGRGRALAAPSTSLVTVFPQRFDQGDGFPGVDVRGMTWRSPGTPARPPGGGCAYNDS